MQVTRVGVYGVAMEEGKILLIKQNDGPFAARFDFPGGGIEFGESPEEALRREFIEEVAMAFDSMEWIDNLTTTTNVASDANKEGFSFYQIGMIYRVKGLKGLEGKAELEFHWVEPKSLTKEECSALLWKYIQM